MDVGVWMSRGVLAHKREQNVRVQVWNLPRIPDGLATADENSRLFVAVDGQWRGFFRLEPGIMHNDEDPACPHTLIFNPRTWTGVLPERAPRCPRGSCYTTDVPVLEMIEPRTGNGKNDTETERFLSLLEREEERE